MAEHRTHTTLAFVLGGASFGEANRLVDLLTEEHGLLRASARSLREERSKLRYSLQPLIVSRVSLVRGSDLWRVTGAELVRDFYHEAPVAEARALIARVARLLKRLVAGEEPHPELFRIFHEGATFVVSSGLSDASIRDAECLLVLRLLRALGYLGKESSIESFAASREFSEALVSAIAPVRPVAIREINRSLSAANL